MYDLSDSGSTGYPHTWTNRREEGLVQERLDRFVASSSWKDSVYRAVSVTNIDAWGSDHSPILVEFWKRQASLFQKENDKRTQWRQRDDRNATLNCRFTCWFLLLLLFRGPTRKKNVKTMDISAPSPTTHFPFLSLLPLHSFYSPSICFVTRLPSICFVRY